MELNDEWFRPAAYYLVKIKGKQYNQVSELFGVDQRRVSRVVKRFEETGSHKNRSGQGRKRTS